MNNSIIHLLSSIINYEDYLCRRELSAGNIVDEPDYVSNFTRGVRDGCRYYGLDAFCYSRKLNRNIETLTGCDAIIIFKFGAYAKICLFEAKWPRVSQRNYQWDSYQGNPQISHFSNQIRRQSVWASQCAIWEQFLNEYSPGYDIPLFHLWGSTCVWHEMAFHFDTTYRNINRLWNNNDLIDLLAQIPTRPFFHRHYGKNVREMILKALLCHKGRRVPVDDDNVIIIRSDNYGQFRIPLPMNKKISVEKFCSEHDFLSYLFINIEKELEKDTFPLSLLI